IINKRKLDKNCKYYDYICDISDIKLKIIAQNSERYISFDLIIVFKNGERISYRFLDSFQFLSCSLEKLVHNNSKDFDKKLNKYVWKDINELKKLFKHTFENFKDYTNDEIKLILQKGIYMYDYMDNVSRFYESKFPNKQAFYSKLDKCNISDEEYNHAKTVYKVFKCKNLKDYTHLYLKCDTLLLADIISEFRNLAIKDYGLDPAWYYTLSGYTWDCA